MPNKLVVTCSSSTPKACPPAATTGGAVVVVVATACACAAELDPDRDPATPPAPNPPAPDLAAAPPLAAPAVPPPADPEVVVVIGPAATAPGVVGPEEVVAILGSPRRGICPSIYGLRQFCAVGVGSATPEIRWTESKADGTRCGGS